MLRPLARLLAVVMVALAVFAAVLVSPQSTPPAQAQTDAQTDAVSDDEEAEEPERESVMDLELHKALTDAGLGDAWLAASMVSNEASYLMVSGGYSALRAQLLGQIEALGGANSAGDRLRRAVELQAEIASLGVVLTEFETELGAQALSLPAEFSTALIAQANATLSTFDAPVHQLGFTLDSMAIAESQVDGIVDQLRQTVQIVGTDGNDALHSVEEVSREVGHLRYDLDEVGTLARSTQAQAERELANLGPSRNALIATFSDHHWRRLLGPTKIDGIPLIAIDAYIRGAAGLGSCPVDWSLLAGIGRVESRHGSLNGSSIGSSGRLTTSILGPLLDGGATEREEAAAAALAEAQALALESAAAAKAEAEAAWLQAQLFGVPELFVEDGDESEVIDPLYGAVAADEPDVDPLYGTPTVEAEEEVVDPLYGDLYELDDRPRLDPPDEDDTDDAEDDGDDGEESDEDEDEDVAPGNGFAVIVDTDNGRLDGNERWDRAVGPMQFIPETWSRWGTDGNGDGVIDPQNIYDAARSAGRFLCDLSRRKGSSPRVFVLGYNSSSSYVRNVLSFAGTYGANDLSIPAAG